MNLDSVALIVAILMVAVGYIGEAFLQYGKYRSLALKDLHDLETKISIEQYQTEPKRLGDNGYDVIDFMSDQYYTVFGHRLT